MQLTRNFRFETTGLSRLEEGGLKQTRLIFRSLSEDQLQAELDLPGRACRAVDLTGRRYPVPAGIKNSRRGIREVRVVQDIEEFRTELQTLTFVNGRGLQQREIHRVILRANQRVPACSPV